MGIEPTTVLPATCFQDKLLVHSAAFHLILSNMSMNSFVEQAGVEPATIPYLSPAGYLEDSNLIPNASGALPFTTAPYSLFLYLKIRSFFLSSNFFLIYFIKKPESFLFDPGSY